MIGGVHQHVGDDVLHHAVEVLAFGVAIGNLFFQLRGCERVEIPLPLANVFSPLAIGLVERPFWPDRRIGPAFQTRQPDLFCRDECDITLKAKCEADSFLRSEAMDSRLAQSS